MALHGDEDRQAACGALGAAGGRDPARGSSHDGAPPLRLPERAVSIPGAADEPRDALERVPGVGHPQGADDDARVPGRGPERFWTKCWGSGPTSIEHQLAHAVRDPNGRAYNRTAFLARTARDDAGLGPTIWTGYGVGRSSRGLTRRRWPATQCHAGYVTPT